LFGTPEACLAKVRRLAALGVNEVACLVDFGLSPDDVQECVRALATILDACGARPDAANDDGAIEELVL
jgi:hypothetical protein